MKKTTRMTIGILTCVMLLSLVCDSMVEDGNPVYMANGIKAGEVDSGSAILWTRLVKINNLPPGSLSAIQETFYQARMSLLGAGAL